MIKIASPFVFFAAAVWLFVDAGFFATPVNDSLDDRLQGSTKRLLASLEEGILPSARSVEALHAERDALRAARRGFGLLSPAPAETVEDVLKEWGYEPDDQVAAAIRGLRSELLTRLGEDRAGEIGVFVNDLARKAGDANLFTSLDLTAEVVGPADPGAPPGEEPSFRVIFSFVSGVAEAAQFVETWALAPPAGVIIRPETIVFRRIAPDIWGTSLKYYSGPPVRADLSVVVTANPPDPARDPARDREESGDR